MVTVFLCTAMSLKADIEFIYAIKERAFEQFNNTRPITPKEWNYGAGVSGNEQVTGVTVTYPGSPGPVTIDENNGSFDLDVQNFETKTEFDAAYPDGNVSLSITDNGAIINLGPFSITGDAYPTIPHIQNAVALRSQDYSQDFILNWNSFEGSDAEDRIIIQIQSRDGQQDEELIFEFLEPSVTTFTIPGGTLEINKIYEIGLIFVNETDGLESPETIIGYISNTRVSLSTFPDFNETDDLEVYMSKGRAAEQVSSGAPNQFRWFYFVEAEVSGITEGTVIVPGGATTLIPLASDEANLIESEDLFTSQAELDSAYPDGDYSLQVLINGAQNALDGITITGQTPGAHPYFTNFDAFQNADPSQSLTFEWTNVNTSAQGAHLSMEIEGAPGYDDFDLDIPGINLTSSSGTLPANSLLPNSKYTATLFYEVPSYTNDAPSIVAGYEVLTQAAFWTTDASVGPHPASALTVSIESESSVRLDWTDNSESETGFRIERKALWEDDWENLATIGTNENSYSDNSVNLGEAYLYRVIAFDANNDGARSNEAQVQIAPLSNPTGLEVDPYNSDTLTLSWDDNSEGESGFEIERSTDGNSWSSIGTTGANENIYIDSGLDDNSTFIYRVRALSALGSSDVSAPDSDSTYEATTGKPINISARGTVGGTDDSIMIAGFIITGIENKDIYITGIAPSLVLPSSPPLLQDPELILFDGAGAQLDTNDDWQDNPRSADIIATTLAPKNEKEAALYVNLAPGVYTVWMRGADTGTGVGLVEVYEANPDNEARLINISTRGIVGSGDGLMIAGIIVKGTGNRTLYIRGNGPSLPDNLAGRLTDTTLEMLDASGQRIAFNDNWRDNENFASIIATTIQPGFIEEAALLVNVPASPGGTAYTIALRGANNTEGLAIIEVFDVPDN